MSTLSEMGCGIYYPCCTLSTNRRIGIYLSISKDLLWITWNYMSRVPRKVLRKIHMWLRTWNGQECTWWALCKWYFQKVLKLVTPKAVGPEVYVSTTATIIYDSYDALEETLNHLNSLKLKINLGENVTYWFNIILVDVEWLESDWAFKTENLGYITGIFEDNSDQRFRIWEAMN